MEEIPHNPEPDEKSDDEVKAQSITLLWILQYAVAGIAYSVASFLTTLGLQRWWKKKNQ